MYLLVSKKLTLPEFEQELWRLRLDNWRIISRQAIRAFLRVSAIFSGLGIFGS